MESEEFHPVTSLIVMVVGFGGFVLMPVSAFLLWSENRTLAWIAIVSTVLGLHPIIGFPLGTGFITYAVTENVTYAIAAAAVALIAAIGVPMLIEYVAERKKPAHDNEVINDVEFDVADAAVRFCPACRTATTPGDRYCQFCGRPLHAPSPDREEPKSPGSSRSKLKWAALAAVVVVGLWAVEAYRNDRDRNEDAVARIASRVAEAGGIEAFATEVFKPISATDVPLTRAVDQARQKTVTPRPLSGAECLELLNWYNASVLRNNEVVQRYSDLNPDTVSPGTAQIEVSYLQDVLRQQQVATPPQRGLQLQATWLHYYQTLIDIWTAVVNEDREPPITEGEMTAMQTELFEQMEDVRLGCA